ncbi:hypothetical protein [Corynebacterium comes]|uniref:VWFA domain-containing protein n=1 Tax=Corynebacterium comes TaxID=2675218 RepID=A0A6B8W0U9_9CORY|nr:hypothetical protein [Corynebacterium comes]QGU04556.1 hypothetical protein CETAM_06470 [Corynebacterium comes]
MARHSSGKNNFAVSGYVIVAGVVILALIAALVWWFSLRDESDPESQAQECIQGDLVLPVAESSPGLAEGLINQWNETGPVVRDHCVTAEVVDSVDGAALLIARDNPEVEGILGERTVSSTVPVDVYTAQLWTGGDARLDDVDPADVTYPVATDPDSAVAVAVALAGDGAPALIQRDRDMTIDSDAEILAVGADAGVHKGAGSTRDVRGAEVVTIAHILNQVTGITEEQTRAAAAFADFHDATGDVPADLPDRSAAWAAVTQDVAVEETTEAETPAPEPEANTPVDTLILLDTSAGTTAAFGDRSIYAASAAALAPISRDLGAGGQQVALWNYSSPLNPGVTQGWRRNVNFSDGAQAADAIVRFGTGGVPQTRSALVAAAANAADQARATGEPARVLLITSGTAQDMDDESFRRAYAEAVGDADVSVETVHVGGGQVDGLLAELTDHTQIADPAQLEAGLRAAAGL